MGRLKSTAVRRAGTNRREFVRRSGGIAFALSAAPLLQACGGANYDDPPGSPQAPIGSFQHGVASGDPLADRVILWTRVTPAAAGSVAVDCVVASDSSLANIVTGTSTTTDATRDYTVNVDVAGLQPNTTYYYRISIAGAQSPVGRTRTLPVGTATRLRMAVVSCASLAHGFFNAYRRIAERADLDLVVHLGDYIYEYGSNQFGSLRAYEPPVETLTLSDYRTRHAQYKRDSDLQEVHRQHPMVAIWDDHEFADNAHVDGAANHTEGAEGTWGARVAAAMQAYYEWMPVRVVDAIDRRRNNRSYAYGNLVDLIMLEERLVARSPQLQTDISGFGVFDQSGEFADPSRQMLGSAQEGWLAARLRESTAQWKIVGQGVMFAQLKVEPAPNAGGGGRFINADQWDGYQPARDRLYDVLKGNASSPPVDNVVMLTGDMHSSWAADLTQDPNNPDTATGGYDPATGAGSRAVEFVATSVTSPLVVDPVIPESAVKLINPHFKYIELTRRGYMLLDVDATRVVGEWWYVDTIETRSQGQSFGVAFQVQNGAKRLIPATQTTPRADAAALAP